MNGPAGPIPNAGRTASAASPRTRRRPARRRSLWSLQVLLPTMILLAGLAVIVQQYVVTLYFGGGEHGTLVSVLTSAALVFGIAGLFWFVTARVLLRPLEGLLATPMPGRSARDVLDGHGRPVAELARIADTIDAHAAMTREHERALSTGSRLARIVEQSLHEVYVVDAESHLVIDANRAARNNLGYGVDELEGMHPLEFIHDWGEAEFGAVASAAVEEPAAQHELRSVHRRKDGSLYPVRASLQYMSRERPPVFVALCQDATEERRGAAQVRLRERAIEAIELGVIISDASVEGYPIVYVNRALCEMTGYAVDELLGRPPSLLQGEELEQNGVLQVHEAQALGASVQTRLHCVRKDGSRFVMRLTLSPVHDPDGALTHYIGIHEDITRELETEARLLQTQRMDAVGQLAGGVAHDFNNLLDIILGNLELLVEGSTDPASIERVDEARQAAGMGARLTRRLLAFARQSSLEPSVVDVNERIEDTLPLLRSSVGESISLEPNLDDALWHARVDPSEIENTLVNLVINARDAIAGEGRIRIATTNLRVEEGASTDLQAGAYVCLSVVDDGRGMSETVRARVFEPFFTTKELRRGTGLGLASVHGFARQSGGTVEIESEAGRGTTVRIYLPRAEEEDRCRTPSDRAADLETALEGRVLVVEDNDKVREVTCLRLQALGLETLEVGDGAEAKRLLTSGERVDLVLSDVVMPGGVSGHDLARWVRETCPGCPVLLVSGFADPATAHDFPGDASAPRMLLKPYDLRALREAIDGTFASVRR